MKRNLLIARHAKTEHNDRVNDFDRNLTEKGLNDIEILAKKIISNCLIPDIIICSSSNRTHDTAKNLVNNLSVNIQIKPIDQLYNSDCKTLFEHIQDIDDEYLNVMIIAHNPGISQLSQKLALNADISYENQLLNKMGMNPLATNLFLFNNLKIWSDISFCNDYSMKWIFRPV